MQFIIVICYTNKCQQMICFIGIGHYNARIQRYARLCLRIVCHHCLICVIRFCVINSYY